MTTDGSLRGSAGSVRKLQNVLHAKAKEEPDRRFHALVDKVWRQDFLLEAWGMVRRNGGAAGVDGVTVADVGHGRYVFPNARYPHRERPMSHATLWSTFQALDIPRDRMTLHGFRAMARTILDEVLGFRPDCIEHQLAHEVRDPNGRAYNQTAFLPERRVMMHPRPIPDVRLGHTPTRHLPRVPPIP